MATTLTAYDDLAVAFEHVLGLQQQQTACLALSDVSGFQALSSRVGAAYAEIQQRIEGVLPRYTAFWSTSEVPFIARRQLAQTLDSIDRTRDRISSQQAQHKRLLAEMRNARQNPNERKEAPIE